MRHYFHDTNALIMVVDSNDEGRLGDAKSELVWLLAEDELRGVPVLVLANKQDLARSLTVEEVAERLDLRSINDRPSRKSTDFMMRFFCILGYHVISCHFGSLFIVLRVVLFSGTKK